MKTTRLPALLICVCALTLSPCFASIVKLSITDADTGQPLNARIGFADPNTWNNCRQISGFTGWAIKHQPWWHAGGEIYHYVQPQSKFQLDTANAALIINKGIEYIPQTIPLSLSQDNIALNIKLVRWINMAEKGWYCGDTHLHISRFEETQNDALFTLFEAEGLNVAPLVDWAGRATGLAPGWGNWSWTPELLNVEYRKNNHLIFAAQDWAWPKKSCVLKLIGHKTPVRGTSRFSQPAIIQKVLDEGGIATGTIGVINIEAAVLNKIAATEVLSFEGFKNLETWYDLLNIGSHIAAIAGTDVQSLATPQMIIEHYVPPGASRLYAYTPAGLNKKSFIQAIARGRTFVTNGPALFLSVDEQLPGTTLELKNPENVRIMLELQSAVPTGGKLEIISNGTAIREFGLPKGQTAIKRQIDILIEEPCWIAAKYTSEIRIPGSELPKAHTSPVYINIAGKLAFVSASAEHVFKRIPSVGAVMTSDATEHEKQIAAEWVKMAREKLLAAQKTASLKNTAGNQ